MRTAFVVLLLLAGAGILCAQSAGSDNAEEVLTALAHLSSLYPRTEGSAGERAAISYIEKSLNEMKVPFQVRSLSDVEGVHSYSQSIEVSLKGRSPDELLVALPIDQPIDATKGDDGALNAALGLGFIRELRGSEPPISIRFLFLGAEYGNGREYPIGTHQFLSDFYPVHPVAALYLNFRFIPARVNIASGSNNEISPYWLINRCSTSLDKAGLFYLLRGNENQIYRLGLSGKPPLIAPYLRAGYPSIELSDLGARLPKAEHRVWIATTLRFFRDFVAANADGFPASWDRHYLFFQARFFSFILSEREYVILLVILMALALVYPMFYWERFRRHLATLARHFLSVPLLLGTIFALLLASTYLVGLITVIRDIPTLWRHAPFPFFALKVTAALFLFAMLFKLLRMLPFARRGQFYTTAALFLLVVDIIAVGTVNISLTYYLVWALVWAIVFSILASPYLKSICLLISTAWLVKAAVDIFTLPALEAVRVVLLSPIRGNLYFAIILLPFILMVIRVELLFRRHLRSRRGLLTWLVDILLGSATAGLFAFLMLFEPFGPHTPQPIDVTELIDLSTGSRSVRLSSPAPIGSVLLVTDTGTTAIDTRSRSYSEALPRIAKVLTVRSSVTSFLDRRQIGLTLRPAGSPNEATIILSSPREIVIYDSNFPFSYDPVANEATIHIGKNPPFPLDVEFTLPGSGQVEIKIVLVYTELPFPLELKGRNISVQKRLVVTDRLPAPG